MSELHKLVCVLSLFMTFQIAPACHRWPQINTPAVDCKHCLAQSANNPELLNSQSSIQVLLAATSLMRQALAGTQAASSSTATAM